MQRVLWQIFAQWSKVERAQNKLKRADELASHARALIDSIAATLPENYRAHFLARASGD